MFLKRWVFRGHLVFLIFSFSFFGQNQRYCYSLVGIGVIIMQKTLTFSNVSVITEDIYLKLAICVHYAKSNLYYQGRQFKIHFFFQNYAPFSTYTIYPLSSTPQRIVSICMRCSCFTHLIAEVSNCMAICKRVST